MLKVVGLPDMRTVTERAAESILLRLKGGRHTAMLRDMIGWPLTYRYLNQDGLSAEDCATLLAGAAEPLDRAPGLRGQLSWQRGGPEALTRWALGGVIARDDPLAPLALGQLRHAAGDLDEQSRELMCGAWDELRRRAPELPEHPVDLTGLAAEPQEDENVDAEPETEQVLADAIAAFDAAAGAAARIQDAIRARRRPAVEDIVALAEAAHRYDEAAAGREAGPEASLDDIRQAIEDTEAERLAARLATVRGPAQVEGELAEIRAAAAGGGRPELAVLARLVLAADDEDDEEIDRLIEQADGALPGTWRKVVSYAARGRLRLAGPAEAEASVAPPVAEPEAAASRPAPESAEPRQGAHPVEPAENTPAQPERAESDEDAAVFVRQEPSPVAETPPRTGLVLLDGGDTQASGAAVSEEVPGGSATDDASEQADPSGVAAPAGADGLDDLDRLLLEDATGAGVRGPARSAPPVPAERQEQAEEREPEPASDEEENRAAVEAEATALRARRLGLAARLHAAMGRPDAEVRARRLAALAAEMTEFGGRLSDAFARAAAGLDRAALAGDPAGQVLAWMAAIRAGIIQPTPESSELIRQHAAALTGHSGLVSLGEIFAQATDHAVYLPQGIAGQLRGSLRAGERQERAVHAARQTLDQGPRKKVHYQRATEAWLLLVREDGAVGRLLTIAAANAVERLEQARQGVAQLDDEAVERLIDDTGRTLTSRRGKQPIVAAARRWLIKQITEARAIVHEWALAVQDNQATLSNDPKHPWLSGKLAELRDAAFAQREQCLDELKDLHTATDPLLSAAARAAEEMLRDTLGLLGGAPLGREPALAEQVTGRDLLLAPGIPMDPATFRPERTPTLADLRPLVDAVPDWAAAFDRRAERGDHRGTEAIIALLDRTEPEQAEALRRKRAALADQARQEQAQRIDKVRDYLAGLRRDGGLAEQEATLLDARLTALEAEDRFDFDLMGAEVDRVRQDADDILARHLEEVAGELADAADQGEVKAAAPIIQQFLDNGDLTTARDFLAYARQGRDLPAPADEPSLFERFFRVFPTAFAKTRRGNRRNEPSRALTMLAEAIISQDHQIADPVLRQALADARLDLAAHERPAEGRDALRHWRNMAQQRMSSPGSVRTSVTGVLRLIGLDGKQRAGTVKSTAGVWIDLTGVHLDSPAPLPQFGSRMSPSGDSLRLLLMWDQPHPKSIVELLRDQPADQTTLVWYFGTLSPADRQRLAAATRERPQPVAVLDDAAVGFLACLPKADWSHTVSILAPFTSVDPYTPAGDVPAEMFYGREEQLNAVVHRDGGCLVYGGRQLGKSALLRAAERQVAEGDGSRTAILVTIYEVGRTAPAKAVWAMLRRPLSEYGIIPPTMPADIGAQEIRQAIAEWIEADPQRQLLILLDEADQFLSEDAEGAAFANVGALSGLMQDTRRRVKVVFAGLHQTTRFKNLSNQPLVHFGTPISVGPLDPQDAYDLLTGPLAALGFRLDGTLAARIIAKANNVPALIQLYADRLLARLRRRLGDQPPPHTITRDDVDAIWSDRKLTEGFRQRFEATLDLDKRYKVIAFTIAQATLESTVSSTFAAGWLFGECRDWWPEGFAGCSRQEFQGLLEESVDLGILTEEHDRYRLRTPYILELLGGEKRVAETLVTARDEFELPDAFDAHSYRAAYNGRPDRSPLTGGQVSDLLRSANQVHLVAGSHALQLDRVPLALDGESGSREGVRVVTIRRGGPSFDSLAQAARQHRGHTLIVWPLDRETPLRTAAEHLRHARTTVSKHHVKDGGTLGVAFTVPSKLAPLWVRGLDPADPELGAGEGVRLVELQRYNAATVRQWMREEPHAFQAPPVQESLLATTGGWPSLIGTVLSGEIVDDAERGLERCRARLRERSAELVTEAGVRSSTPLEAAWRTLVEIDVPGTQAELAELLASAADEDHDPLAEGALREHGYRTTGDLVEVLRILGALTLSPGPHPDLTAEPVLAKATRAAFAMGPA